MHALREPSGETYDGGKRKLRWKTFDENTVVGCCDGCATVPQYVLKAAKAHHAIACDTRGGRNNNKRAAFKALRKAVLRAQGTQDLAPSILDS